MSKDNENILFPNEKEVPQFMRGVFSLGLANAAVRANSEALSIFKKLQDEYLKDLDDINILSDHPLFLSIFNSYNSSLETIKSFQEGKRDLIDTINNVVLIRVDKLVALSRETVRQVTNLDKL
jgi:hypothetical protein